MTKRIAKAKGGTRATKLQLRKETIKDLGSLKDKAAAVKGGACPMGTCNASCLRGISV